MRGSGVNSPACCRGCGGRPPILRDGGSASIPATSDVNSPVSRGRLTGPIAVWLGDDLEQVAAQILEVDATATEIVVDLSLLLLFGIGPVLELARLDAAEDLVELLLAHEERVVLHLDFHAVGGKEGEGHFVADLDIEERAEGFWRGEAEEAGEEFGGGARVLRVDDGVVQFDGHGR